MSRIAAIPTVGDERGKWALLIGIDKYPHITQLDGCVNDVELMRTILMEAFGFPATNVRLISNGDASRDAILAELDALVHRTGPEDMVVIHYAGHGSQMSDREGDEPSGFDSTIVPFDSGRGTAENRDISDDEIHLRLMKLGETTPYVTLIFDSCHSGTITRDAFGAKARSVTADTRPQSELPPSPIPAEVRQVMTESGPSGWMPLSDRYLLIAGCRDEETSFEYRPPQGDGTIVHGALTYFLSEELRRLRPGTSYRDVFERVSAKVNATNPRQHPQMEGHSDREVFGVKDVAPMRFASVVAREGDSVTIGMGAALGITVGSSFSVYAQTAEHGKRVEPLGTIEIARVRATSSDARVTAESVVRAIGVGARAVETIHAYGDLRLGVQLVASARDQPALSLIRDALAASPILCIVDDPNSAPSRVYLLPARDIVTAGDPVPQLGALVSPTWAVVGQDGQLLMLPKAVDSYREVVENLERLARYRQALALDNPDPDSQLRGRVSLDLLRKWADGKWLVAKPEAAGGHVLFEDGDAIAFRLTNLSDEPLFVSLLDFGLTGSVSVVYPARGAAEQLRPAGFFEIGTTSAHALTLRMPREFPYLSDYLDHVVGGIETIKMFVTRSPANFDFLSQEKMRSGTPASESPLMHLWRTATAGSITRDIQVSVPIGEEDWVTVVKPLLLTRRPNAGAGRSDEPS